MNLRKTLIPALLALGIFFALLAGGKARAISPSATSGHIVVTKGTGIPTGVPSLQNADLAQTYFDVGANKFYLYNAGWQQVGVGGNYTLNKTVASVACTNTTTETTLYTFSVPGGTLSTANRLRLEIRGSLSTKGAGPGTFTVKTKYGGTSLSVVAAATLNASASSAGASIVTILTAAGTTGSQLLHGSYLDGSGAGNSGTPNIARASTSIDSTASQALVVTWTFGTADAANSFALDSAFLELLQ